MAGLGREHAALFCWQSSGIPWCWWDVDASPLRVEPDWGPPPGAGDCPWPGEIPPGHLQPGLLPPGHADPGHRVTGTRSPADMCVCVNAQARAGGGSSHSQPLPLSPLQATTSTSWRRRTLPRGTGPAPPACHPPALCDQRTVLDTFLPHLPPSSPVNPGSGSCCRRCYSQRGSLWVGGPGVGSVPHPSSHGSSMPASPPALGASPPARCPQPRRRDRDAVGPGRAVGRSKSPPGCSGPRAMQQRGMSEDGMPLLHSPVMSPGPRNVPQSPCAASPTPQSLLWAGKLRDGSKIPKDISAPAAALQGTGSPNSPSQSP